MAPVLRTPNTIEVRGQSGVLLQEIPLLNDDEAIKAIEMLRSRGYSPEDVRRAMEHQPVSTTKAKERQAARSSLDDHTKTEVGRILATRRINPQGKDLDKKRLNKTNFVVLKAAIDNQVNLVVGNGTGERHELTKAELDAITADFPNLVAKAVKEVFGV
ncbi:MAG: hypothetical protein ABI036_01295 [Fibrobacteria bacterium]